MTPVRAVLLAALLAVPAAAASGSEAKPPETARGKEAKPLEEVLAAMERAEKDVLTLQFDYAQTAEIRLTGETQTLRGKAYFRRPDRFRIEHVSPQSQVVVSDGKTLWFHNVARGQVLVDSWKNWADAAEFPKGLAPFQWDAASLRERYDVALEDRPAGETGSAVIVRLTPKETTAWPYTFRLWVDPASGLPERTELESSSVKAVTRLSRTRVNPDLPDSLFTLRIPEGTEVLGAPASGEARPQGTGRPASEPSAR
jgi:chaperone LolA